MNIEQQVVCVEFSNKIKVLGFTAPSIFYRDWTGAKENEIEQNDFPRYNIDNVNCYTVAELIMLLQQLNKDDIIIAGDDNNVADSLANKLIKIYEEKSKV